jgi:peptidoglycan hydrolase CwlO-like protein
MRKTTLTIAVAALTFAFAAAPQLSMADETTAKDVGKKLSEAGTAIKDYSVDQRDEAVKAARAALDDLDASINRLAADIDGKWDKLDASARKKAYESMDKLRKERNDAAEWMGGLKHSSKDAWGEVKNGFAKSYEALANSFSKAKEEF